MKEYIDKEIALKVLEGIRGMVPTTYFMFIVNHLPVEDVRPVVHGKWVDETFKPYGLVFHPYKCDQCGEHSGLESEYCPNCGARMDLEESE